MLLQLVVAALRCLRSYDPSVLRILSQVSYVALYRLDVAQKKWSKMDVMGGLHFTQRRIPAGAPLGPTGIGGRSWGTLMLPSHELPITAEMYLRFGKDKEGPSRGPLFDSPTAASGDGGAGFASSSSAAAAAVGGGITTGVTTRYRMFIINQCREEIFFQDVIPGSGFVLESGPSHIFYKIPNETHKVTCCCMLLLLLAVVPAAAADPWGGGGGRSWFSLSFLRDKTSSSR